MKEYTCVQVRHHKEVGSMIEKMEAEGWHFLTYQAAGLENGVIHYMLFDKGS